MKKNAGFALIESLIAVLILILGIVSSIGMQARGLNASTEASMRSEATMAADQLIGMMWSDLENIEDYEWDGSASPPAKLAAWYDDLNSNYIPGAQVSIIITPFGPDDTGTKADVVLSWVPKGSSEIRRLAFTTFLSPP